MYRIVSLFAVAAISVSMVFASIPRATAQEIGRIDLQIVKAGFIVGLSGGRGTLYFGGKAYPLSVGGLSLGPSIAISSYDVTGTVYNLTRPEDIYGNYTAGSAGVAFVGGGKVASLSNVRGVRLEVRARTIGVELSLDLSGINIQPR